jgi:hypothetical protein
VPPVKDVEAAVRLCRGLAEYYQRRLNRLLGVGTDGHKERRARAAHRRSATEEVIDIAMLKARRDCASELARRIHRGHEQALAGRRKKKKEGR